MANLERIAVRLNNEFKVSKLRGTVGEKIFLGGFAGNIALIGAVLGARLSGNDELSAVLRNTTILPAHLIFDATIAFGAYKLRCEAEDGRENFIFNKRQSEGS